jgi:hypothetical protein
MSKRSDQNDQPSRRKILTRTGAAGGGLVVASSLGVGPRTVLAAPEAIQVPRRVLGKTGEKVPILLMGGSLHLDPRFDPKLAECLKYGVNYIDAADCYSGGMCEPAVGAFISRLKVRDKYWITSKSDEHDPAGFEETLNKSLQKLQTSYIDMYYLHMLRDAKYLNRDLETLVARLKKEKKIRFFGFSCHHDNVAELLEVAAKTPWVDSVMFRYNFRQYGNEKLNRAMNAAYKAKVGLIAMKTQGSAVSFEDKWKGFTGKWNKFQSVMKAVWADERISAAVSAMDSLEKVHENIGASVDKTKLTQAEWQQIWRYAHETRHMACDGCDHLCGEAVEGPAEIGSAMRYLMYHDVYGQKALARELWSRLPADARNLSPDAYRRAAAACPNGLDIAGLMARANQILA